MSTQTDKQHDQKLTELREEKKAEGSQSPDEKRKAVMNGAKLQCKYMPAPGTLMVTSNQIKLQDQMWATEGDFGKPNLQFQGMCMHSKWGSYPPPCISVISCTQWEDVGTTLIQGKKMLLSGSTIKCAVSNEPIKIIMDGQMSTPSSVSAAENDVCQSDNPQTQAPKKDAPPKVLVSAAKGESEALPGTEMNYEVTGYKGTPTQSDKSSIKWAIKMDGKIQNLSAKGEKLTLKIEHEWAGKTIIVMPFMNQPAESVSVQTKIVKWELPRYFAKSSKEPGHNANGAVADDMQYSTTTHEKLVKKNKLFWFQTQASDEMLFVDLSNLSALVSFYGGSNNSQALIAHFRANTGSEFSSQYLNNGLANHSSLKDFLNNKDGVVDLLTKELKSQNGNLNKIELLKGRINSNRVKFAQKRDLINGLTFAVDDTHSYKIYIEEFELVSKSSFNAKLKIEIFDHFGLDNNDIEKFIYFAGFRAWYVLQHARGYKPFITKMTYYHEIKNQTF